MRLSVDDLALLTYCLGVAPSPGMGLLDRHQVSTPTDVTEPPDIMSGFLRDVSCSFLQ